MSIFSKTPPLKKQIQNAFFDALEKVLISNGKNPKSIDFATFQEIKHAIAEFEEQLEQLECSKIKNG